MDTLIEKIFFKIVRINIFRVELTDISAKKEALVVRYLVMMHAVIHTGRTQEQIPIIGICSGFRMCVIFRGLELVEVIRYEISTSYFQRRYPAMHQEEIAQDYSQCFSSKLNDFFWDALIQ